MGRKRKPYPAIRITVTLPKECVDSLEGNLERLRLGLVRSGADPQAVDRELTRSSLVRQCVEFLSTETGFAVCKGSFCAALGVNADQTDLFDP